MIQENLEKIGFRELNAAELTAVSGGDGPQDPRFDEFGNLLPGYYITEDGQILSDDPLSDLGIGAFGGDSGGDGSGDSGNHIIVNGSSNSSSSGGSSLGGVPVQGFDINDPTSETYQLLNDLGLLGNEIIVQAFLQDSGSSGGSSSSGEAFAAWLAENPLEDMWIDANNDGLHDLTGEGRPIIVYGDASPYQGVPDGYIRMPGTDLYMYPIGPDGLPDTSNGPEFTPEGLAHVCETYEQGVQAVDQTMGQSGTVGTLTGIAGGPPGSIPLIGGIAALTVPEPLDHCQDGGESAEDSEEGSDGDSDSDSESN